jgi:hypothetical protein
MISEIGRQDCSIRRREERKNGITKCAALFLIERSRCTAERTKSLVSLLMLPSVSLGFRGSHERPDIPRSLPK